MPFQPHTGPLVAPGLEAHSVVVPCFGETASGDGLFVETGRDDGAVLLLLVDVMGHGDEAAAVVAALGDHYLRLPACLNQTPASLLAALHSLLLPLWDAEGL